MKILVTGSAGFIGFHLAKWLIKENHEVVGLDNLNHYYDVKLKLDRLAKLGIDAYGIAMGKKIIESTTSNFRFAKMDLQNQSSILDLFKSEKFDIVVNLAAQAGVRYSIENPQAYVNSNLLGFANLLEACRQYPVKHFIFASSSSVYGANKSIPFKTSDKTDQPRSFYAATKKCNELMAYSYSYLYNIPTTGLRFFTVYGEWGRPDMAPMLFAKAILGGQPIKVFNEGKMSRDFTYIGDIIEGIMRIINQKKESSTSDKEVNYKLYNIGNSKPVKLLTFIETLEQVLKKKATKVMYPMQPGDVVNTYADVSDLINDFNYQPKTSLLEGLTAFANWYVKYYHNEASVLRIRKQGNKEVNKSISSQAKIS